MSPEAKAAYVAAFIDGEGSIQFAFTKRKAGGKEFPTRNIIFFNTDRTLIEFMVQCLTDLGFKTIERWHDREGRGIWSVRLRGGREYFEKFKTLIPVQHPTKKSNLNAMIESYGVSHMEAQAFRRNGETITCQVCGVRVYLSRAYLLRGDGKFCSGECRATAQRSRVTKLCESCGASFEVITARAEKARFCSQSCAGKAKAVRLRLQAKDAAKARWARRIVG